MSWVVVAGGVAIVSAVAALVGVGMDAAARGHWGTAAACLGSFAVIVGLTLFGIEYAQGFWEGR